MRDARKEAAMHEVCFCGRTGALAEREPIYLGDGDWGLAGPRCGHLDRLDSWPPATRAALVAEAWRRREAVGAADTPPAHVRAAEVSATVPPWRGVPTRESA
jgi:hypothetical protein